MQKPKRRHSLKWNMIAPLLLCWILPVVVVVSFSGLYIANMAQKQTKEIIMRSTENALDVVHERLNAAITASLESSYNPTLLDAWLTYKLEDNYSTFANTASKWLSQLYKFDDKFLTTYMLLTDDEDHIFSVTDNRPYAEAVSFWKNMKGRIQQASAQIGTEVAFLQDDTHLYMMRNLKTSTYHDYAILVMELNTQHIFAGLEDVPFTEGYTLWLNDEYARSVGMEEAVWDASVQNIGELAYQDFDGKLSIFGQTDASYYKMRYTMPVDTQLIEQQMAGTKMILLLIVVMLTPLLGLVLWFFYRKITMPMDLFAKAAKEIEKGQFGVHINADLLESLEFGYLGDSFNSMSDKLQYQFECLFKEEIAVRDARIMALQSQINPHFLNNTLEIINWEARIAGDIKVCKMIEALSTMLSAAMDRKSRPLVHLSEEMMYVDSYLYIIRERLGKRLNIIKEIDNTLLDCLVPRLVLQPIIENAVEHGINPTRQGNIIIRAYGKENVLYLEIENDSPLSDKDKQRIDRLLSEEILETDTGSSSLGIRNVNQRLKMLYGNSGGLLVNMTTNQHTLSQICIQIQQG